MTLRTDYVEGEVLGHADVNSANETINGLGVLLDPLTGKLAAGAVPDGTSAAIAKAEADAQAGIAAAAAAHGTATQAETDAQAGIAASAAALSAANAAKAEADAAKVEADANAALIAAINAAANLAGGFAKLLGSGKLPLGIMPYSAGSNVSIGTDGVISAAGGGGGQSLTPPTPAQFPLLFNSGPIRPTSLLATAGRGLKVSFENVRGDNGVRSILHAIPPPGTPWQVTACLDLANFSWAYQAIGLARFDSVAVKHQQLCLMTNSTSGVVTQSELHEFVWTGTASVADSLLYNMAVLGGRLWMRFTDNGAAESDATAQLWEVSRSGDDDDWWTLRGGMRTDHLGSDPTHFGIAASCASGNVLSAPDPTCFIRHYVYTHS